MNWELATRALPFLAATIFTVVILYGFAFFEFVGPEWLTILTPQDLFALSWRGLPAAAIGFAASLLIPIGAAIQIKTHAEFLDQIQHAPLLKKSLIILYYLFVRFSPILVPIFLISVPSWADPEQIYRWIIPATTISFLLIYRTIGLFYSEGKIKDARLISFICGISIVVFVSGLMNGASAVSSFTSIVTLKGHAPICAAVPLAGERGVLFQVPGGQSSFARWDNVETISRSKSVCFTKPPARKLLRSPRS